MLKARENVWDRAILNGCALVLTALLMLVGCVTQQRIVFDEMEVSAAATRATAQTALVDITIEPVSRWYEYPGAEDAIRARMTEFLREVGIQVVDSGADLFLRGQIQVTDRRRSTMLTPLVLLVPPIGMALPAYEATYTAQADLQLLDGSDYRLLFDEQLEAIETFRYSMYNSLGSKRPQNKINRGFRTAVDELLRQMAMRVAAEL